MLVVCIHVQEKHITHSKAVSEANTMHSYTIKCLSDHTCVVPYSLARGLSVMVSLLTYDYRLSSRTTVNIEREREREGERERERERENYR